MKSPIFITGCARSGTSMTAGVIDICGGWGGDICGATRANKKGQFENREIVNSVVKPFLRTIQVDPMGQYPLPDINHIIIQRGNAKFWNEKIMSIMKAQGLKNNMDWYLKGAKICLIWPLWHRAFPDSKWIWVNRSKYGIINSCLKTNFMRAFDSESGWDWWIDQHRLRFNEMASRVGLDMVVIHPAKMISGDFAEVRDLIKWLNLNWKESEVRKFIDPALWHYKESI